MAPAVSCGVFGGAKRSVGHGVMVMDGTSCLQFCDSSSADQLIRPMTLTTTASRRGLLLEQNPYSPFWEATDRQNWQDLLASSIREPPVLGSRCCESSSLGVMIRVLGGPA